MLPGDTLTRDGCLAFFSERMPGFHVGGKTALAERGVRQNVSFREHLTLWGDQSKRLPAWFTERFSNHYQATELFDTKLRKGFGLQPLPNGDPKVLVSVPERALLEMLSDVGKNQSLDEARQLVETLRSLREKTLDELLVHTTRIKVVRLAELLSSDLNIPWAPLAKRHSQRIGVVNVEHVNVGASFPDRDQESRNLLLVPIHVRKETRLLTEAKAANASGVQ